MRLSLNEYSSYIPRKVRVYLKRAKKYLKFVCQMKWSFKLRNGFLTCKNVSWDIKKSPRVWGYSLKDCPTHCRMFSAPGPHSFNAYSRSHPHKSKAPSNFQNALKEWLHPFENQWLSPPSPPDPCDFIEVGRCRNKTGERQKRLEFKWITSNLLITGNLDIFSFSFY